MHHLSYACITAADRELTDKLLSFITRNLCLICIFIFNRIEEDSILEACARELPVLESNDCDDDEIDDFCGALEEDELEHVKTVKTDPRYVAEYSKNYIVFDAILSNLKIVCRVSQLRKFISQAKAHNLTGSCPKSTH